MKRTPLKRGGPLKRGPSSGLKRGGPIKPKSVKRQKANREYLELRREFLFANPICFYRFDMCTGTATDIDHIVPRGLAPGRVNDPTNWNQSCRACHQHRTNDLTREERQALGLGIYSPDYSP